jgi:hypothetical protein
VKIEIKGTHSMRTLLFVCWLALSAGILLGSLNGAGAQPQPSDDAVQACTPDAMRLCSDFIPDRDKVRLCMLRKRSELSEACRVAMGAGKGHRVYRHRRHPAHHDT